MVDTSGRKLSEFVSEARAAKNGESWWTKFTRSAGRDSPEMGGIGQQVNKFAGRYSDDAAFAANSTMGQGTTFNPNSSVSDGGDAADAAIIARQAGGQFRNRVAQQHDELAALQRGFNPDDLGTAASRMPLTESDIERAKALGAAKPAVTKPAAPDMTPTAGAKPQKAGAPTGAAIGEEAGVFKALAPVEKVVDTATNVVGIGTAVTDFALPVAGGIAGLAGLQKTRSFIRKPVDYLNPEADMKAGKMTKGDKINNGLMLGISAMQAYGVAKGFTQNLDALKHMYSDLTGTPVEKISTIALLTGSVPDVMKEPRRHFINEHVLRGGVSAMGAGLIARAMFKGRAMGWIEGLAPVAASVGADIMLGESILPHYASISNAQRSGQQLPPQVYTEFLMNASSELRNRGRIGLRMGILLGEELAQERAKIADVLKELEDSKQAHKHGKKAKLDERIDNLLTKAEAQQKANQPAMATQPQASMVERVNGHHSGKEMVVKGKHTQRLKSEIVNKEQSFVPGMTTP